MSNGGKIVLCAHPTAPLSATVEAGDFVFMFRQLPFELDGSISSDVAAPTKQGLAKLRYGTEIARLAR